MAKLVDALALGASGAIHGSSSLPLPTDRNFMQNFFERNDRFSLGWQNFLKMRQQLTQKVSSTILYQSKAYE